jgi:predicted acyltransferase (DUF342 family)
MLRIVSRLAVLTIALVGVQAAPAESSTNRINGSIDIEAGQSAGDLRTVNGSIRLGERAVAEDISTVNGDVTVRSGARAASAPTVNGDVDVRGGSKLSGSASTVNGSVSVERLAEISGDVGTVNGRILVDGGYVKGRLKTVSGDIDIGRDSRVDGGIYVEEPKGWSYKPNKARVPRVVIGPNAVVSGTLEFARTVELYVSSSAKIGTVKGATPKLFSGDRP